MKRIAPDHRNRLQTTAFALWISFISSSRRRLAGGHRGRFRATVLAACFVPLACCLLVTYSCGPGRNSSVQATATSGYCPVCKMKVNAADEWTAEIYYNDGTKLLFESPGDLMAFYSNPGKYKVQEIQKDRANISRVSFKDYRTKEPVDGRQATLVVGSRIEGPMGPDFLPFGNSADAASFVAENGGRTVTLNDVTSEMVHTLRSSR